MAKSSTWEWIDDEVKDKRLLINKKYKKELGIG